MRLRALLIGGICVSFTLVTSIVADDKRGDQKVPAVLNFKMKSLDGKDVELSRYQGKVVLMVNTALKQIDHRPRWIR